MGTSRSLYSSHNHAAEDLGYRSCAYFSACLVLWIMSIDGSCAFCLLRNDFDSGIRQQAVHCALLITWQNQLTINCLNQAHVMPRANLATMIAVPFKDTFTDPDLTAKRCATQCVLKQRRRLFVYAFVCISVSAIWRVRPWGNAWW